MYNSYGGTLIARRYSIVVNLVTGYNRPPGYGAPPGMAAPPGMGMSRHGKAIAPSLPYAKKIE